MSRDVRGTLSASQSLILLLCLAAVSCSRSGFDNSRVDSDGFTPQDSDGFTPQDSDGFTPQDAPADADQPGDVGRLTLTGPSTIAGGSCSSAYRVTLTDHDGFPTSIADSTLLSTVSEGRGALYRDNACTVRIDSVFIAGGTSSSTFYVQSPLGDRLSILVADANGDFGTATTAVTVTPTALVVTPVYASHGTPWNSYVKDDGADAHSAAGVACGQATDGPCLHAGELKRVALDGVDDCSGLEPADALRAFTWTCRPASGAAGVVFFSAGLQADKGLADLVEASAWRSNRFEVRVDGAIVADSSQTIWWNNPVAPLPLNHNHSDARIVLDDVDDDAGGPDEAFVPGTVFTVASDQDTNGYNIDLDGISLVTLGEATLRYAGSDAVNCHEIYGETISGHDSKICLLAAGTQRFLWLEGSFDGLKPLSTGANILLNLASISFSTLRHVHAENASGNGLVLRKSTRNRIMDTSMVNTSHRGVILTESDDNLVDGLSSIDAGDMGMSISESNANVLRRVHIEGAGERSLYFGSGSGNLFEGLTAVGGKHRTTSLAIYAHDNRFVGVHSYNNAGYGLLVGGDRNIFVNVVLSNNRLAGLSVSCSWRGPLDNTFVGVVAANNGGTGISVSGDDEQETRQNTLSHLTAVNNGGAGVSVGGSDRNLLHQVVAANNQGAGMLIAYSSPTDNWVHDLAAAHNGSADVDLRYARQSRFEGRLVVGNEVEPCSVHLGDQPGLVDNTCSVAGTTGSSDYGTQLSTAVLHVGLDLTNAFVGKVAVDDPINRSDQSGAAALRVILDWSGFSSPYRLWGVDGGAFPNADHRGQCASGTCRIWDLRLHRGGSMLAQINGAFAPAAPCPASVAGATAIVDQQTTPNTFVGNAVELMFDGRGDDDGLCESNESCVYSPHLGAFQGDGAVSSTTCRFSNGVVTGVTMHAFATSAY